MKWCILFTKKNKSACISGEFTGRSNGNYSKILFERDLTNQHLDNFFGLTDLNLLWDNFQKNIGKYSTYVSTKNL